MLIIIYYYYSITIWWNNSSSSIISRVLAQVLAKEYPLFPACLQQSSCHNRFLQRWCRSSWFRSSAPLHRNCCCHSHTRPLFWLEACWLLSWHLTFSFRAGGYELSESKNIDELVLSELVSKDSSSDQFWLSIIISWFNSILIIQTDNRFDRLDKSSTSWFSKFWWFLWL